VVSLLLVAVPLDVSIIAGFFAPCKKILCNMQENIWAQKKPQAAKAAQGCYMAASICSIVI
jgi:hypothetical protein